jgi:agmatinase
VREFDPITSDSLRIRPGELVVMGAPWEGGSSYLPGAAAGPARIREALWSPARSLVTEAGENLGRDDRLRVLGDLRLTAAAQCAETLERTGARILDGRARFLALGGDHSITVGLLRAVGRHFPNLTLVQIDAHPDLYEEFEGDRWSHACPMARILEEGLVGRLVQIGIRAMTPEQQSVADRFAVEVVDMRDWRRRGLESLGLSGPIYVSLDLDGLDPAHAPGVSHPEPGGLTTREVIELIQEIPGPIISADLVELNALRDPQGLTAVTAAKLVKELAARLLETERS